MLSREELRELIAQTLMADAETAMLRGREITAHFEETRLRIEELEGVLGRLVAKVDETGKASAGVFVLAKVHGMPYKGPTHGEELEAARKVFVGERMRKELEL